MKKILIISILFMYTYTSTNAQRLKIGEKCPDKILKHVFNFKTDSLRLSQFNVDLIILDFWGLSCISCIQAFPKIDALQKKFNGRVQIIAVNKQTLEQTADFFAKRKKIQIPSVPFITQATVLSEWFPQEFVPWHVWLDKNLIVRYITFGHNATEENIKAFLNKDYPVMKQLTSFENKKDSIRSIQKFSYYSLITPAVVGAVKRNDYASIENDKVLISEEGSPIASLAQKAIAELYGFTFHYADSMILEVADPSHYKWIKGSKNRSQWLEENLYNYYLMLPAERKPEAYRFMKEDIERYFNIKISLEKRMTFHYVLKRTDSIDRLKTKGGLQVEHLLMTTDKFPVFDTMRFLQNCPFSKLALRLKTWSYGLFELPFSDETGYTGNIDITLDAESLDAHDPLLLRKELLKYGLNFTKELREQDVLVIKEK